MNICVVGTGYVGLVTGACFAELGNSVWCVDADEAKINNLKSGVLPIYESGLKEMVENNIRKGCLQFTTDIKAGIAEALFCFITVGTPPTNKGGVELGQVMKVAQALGRLMENYLVVVNKSTVPVGTAEKIKKVIQQELSVRGKDTIEFDVVSNPEFLREGVAIEDFMYPDRIVIGADNQRAVMFMKQLYEPLVSETKPILQMDVKSAEITKYAANAMLATRISFINQIAQFCDRLGGDIDSVRKGIGTDHRIGMEFLAAGIGYGGSCFPKDVKALISMGRKHGIEMEIAVAVEKVNERQKHYLIELIKKRLGDNLSRKKIGVWGLAFKPQTDDMREAPSIVVIRALLNMGATVVAFDPIAIERAKKVFSGNIQYVNNMLEAVAGVDALVLITDWNEFRQVDISEIKKYMKHPIVFDGRNQYDPSKLKAQGFEYYCIGKNNYVK